MIISKLQNLYQTKQYSPVEHTAEMFKRIKANNERLKAYVYLNEESAMEAAKEAEKNYMADIVKSPLQGITVGLKDLIWTRDAPVRLGCQYYYEHPIEPKCDSTVVKRLRGAGAIILGKTNTHALALGSTGDDSWGGCAVNPHDTTRVAGGSSSGSAAAVAAGLCDISFGTDTGGSVRIPAACCGAVGIKPTFGRVSKFGVQALGLSCDCVGPIANCVKDGALAMGVTAGGDDKDMYSLHLPSEDYTEYLANSVSAMTVAVPYGWLNDEPLDPQLRNAALSAIEILKSLGVKIIDASAEGLLPKKAALQKYRQAHQILLVSDGYYLHQEALKTSPEKISVKPLERLLSGNVSALERNQAFALREELRSIYFKVFDRADALLTPSVAILPSKLGETSTNAFGGDISIYSLLTEFSWQASFGGFPSMSLPFGKSKCGLPMGVMFNARPLGERYMLALASALENNKTDKDGYIV